MKQVINGKLYDTETAEQIAKHAPNTDTQSFDYLIETLYKTDKGEYFLHGKGGAKTKYKQRAGSGYTGGQTIKPFTPERALEWCERREIDGEIVVEEFGDLIEEA